MKNLLFHSLLFLSSCATSNSLTSEGQHVRLMKADPPSNCVEIKGVEGTHLAYFNADAETAKIHLKNAAGSLGANYVRMETSDTDKDGTNSRYTINGTAYKCPPEGIEYIGEVR